MNSLEVKPKRVLTLFLILFGPPSWNWPYRGRGPRSTSTLHSVVTQAVTSIVASMERSFTI